MVCLGLLVATSSSLTEDVSAAPVQYDQFFETQPFGATSSETTDSIGFSFNGGTYVLESAANAAVTLYSVEPWGEFVPIAAYGDSASQTQELALGNFNGDVYIDFVACNATGQNTLWKGTSDGTFIFGTSFGTAGMSCSGIAAAQIDGQTFDDLVIANSNGQLEVWESLNGQFVLANSFGDVGFNDVAILNVDTDANLDLFAVGETVPDQVWLGDGSGVFALDASQELSLQGGLRIDYGDVDADGDSDIFVAAPISRGYNNLDGLLAAYIGLLNFSAKDVLVAPIDGETGSDLLWVGPDGTRYFSGQPFTWWNDQFVTTGGTSVTAVDLDGDGDLDVIIGMNGTNKTFRGGPIRSTISLQQSQFDFESVMGATDSAIMNFVFGGNGRKQFCMAVDVDWLSIDGSTCQDLHPDMIGSSFWLDADSSLLPGPGEYSATLKITSNDPQNASFEVPITYTVLGAELEITPTNISAAANQGNGNTVSEAVTVTNIGAAAVTVQLAEQTNSGWIKLPTVASKRLLPGEVHVFLVELDPNLAEVGLNQSNLVVIPDLSYVTGASIPVTFTVGEKVEWLVFLPVIIK
ncbi:MAG: hypothetical protein CO156_01140 [Candidatus Pacebacteria bacterium CG_4_9_14_3_um_filter_40_12]|nr:MAG: hypothetical protein CO156_01140 [Candidatus Pacebacteria bacterium CG_4_9_14_3_um_filter_40_12]